MSLLERLGDRLGGVVEELARDPALQRRLDRARDCYDGGELAEAERILTEVLGENADLPRAWALLGLSQLAQGRPEPARASLQRAADQRPDDLVTSMALGEALLAVDDPEAALEQCRKLLRSGRADRALMSQIYGLSGRAWLARKEADQAVRELRKACTASAERDLELAGLLGRAYYLKAGLPALSGAGRVGSDASRSLPHREVEGALRAARQQLELAASAEPPDMEVLSCLVATLLQLDEAEEAKLAALRLVDAAPDNPQARLQRAETLLRTNRPVEARDALLRALELAPRHAEVHQLLARTHAAIGDAESALRHLQVARDLAGEASIELVHDTVLLRLRQLDDPWRQRALLEQLAADAEQLLDLAPRDALGLAARALSCTADDPDEALRLAEQSLAQRDTFAGRLGLGVALTSRGSFADAAVQLRRAARLEGPAGTVARRQLKLLRRRQVGLGEDGGATSELRPMLVRLQRFVEAHQPLRDLSNAAVQVAQDCDRPLLVAVMGEFNSGKSTFVNALVGETIAPIGVTPTTATINLLQYGQQKQVRVVWRDDREELVAWDGLANFLGGLSHAQAADVRWVELLYPAEELLRVNVVDTPGLNSMIPTHERTAREMLQHADAVIWLFSADQAGKQTEQQALQWIKQLRLKTVGVINKIDRLSEDELERVLAHLRDGFEPLLSALMPVSARQALSAMGDGQHDQLQRSRFPQLRAFLEQELFARSRRLKHDVALRRAQEIVALARQRLDERVDQLAGAEGKVEQILVGMSEHFDRLAQSERGRLLEGAERVYRRAAEQTLDFVRPRRWLLGEHSTEPADRDFVIDLLEGDFEGVCQASESRMSRDLQACSERWIAQLDGLDAAANRRDERPGSDLAHRLRALVVARQQLLTEQVYARFGAFLRGYLRGGWVDRFFEQRLPRLELDQEAIYQALVSEPVALDAELLAPLVGWANVSRWELSQLLREGLAEASLERWELETCWGELLDELAGC